MRNSNGNGNGIGILLIALGALVLLGVLGPLLGMLFKLLIPIAMIALGYYGIQRGNTFFGWIVLAIGVLSLIGKLSWIIGPILGIVLIVYGVSRLKNGRRRY
ncbi:LiaF transmembrane domain-containing protein [Paenibacillus sp. EC2-1]|uniref:LiaF transmembrane domain-containing protein n=1 Tax=Paenibacillus sp. EC2-1 TaxID=3388665 RepID=UPI003BEF0CD3